MLKNLIKMLFKQDIRNRVVRRTCSRFIDYEYKFQQIRMIHRTGVVVQKQGRNLMVFDDFSQATERNKNTFLEMVRLISSSLSYFNKYLDKNL